MPRAPRPLAPASVLPPFRRVDLGALGLDLRWLDAAVAAGFVVQPVWGAYLDARSAADPLAVARAAALVLPPHVVACRGLAALVHGVDPRGPAFDPSPVPLTGLVPTSNRVPKWAGAAIYEAPLDAHDVVDAGGLLVTTPERTALDCARYLSPPMALAVLDRMAGLGLVDPAVLLTRIEEFRGDRWVGRARYLITHVEPGAESYGESWLRLRLLEAGFPRPQVQVWVPEERPGAHRLDLGWEELRKGGEYDGEEALLTSVLSTRTGTDHYPGDAAPAAGWPGTGPGAHGVLNTLAPKHFDVSALASLADDDDRRPPVLWVRGEHDAIVSDAAALDLAVLGGAGVVPGWPGAEAYPVQPMVSQTRAVLDAYAAGGGRYREVVLDAGHSPHVERPEEFAAALHAHLAAAAEADRA